MMMIEQDGILYQIDINNYTAKIVSLIKAKDSVFLPLSIIHDSKEYEITEISEKSFKSNQIKSVTFADDSKIKTIPKNAFLSSSIESLHLPSNIEYLEDGWCTNTTNLINITISPNNLYFQIYNNQLLIGRCSTKETSYSIVYFAFRNIETVVIPSAIQTINSYSFEFCQKLKTVSFESDSSLSKIGQYSFSNSTIKYISIPKTVTNIDYSAFHNCENITFFGLDTQLRINSKQNNPFGARFSPIYLDFLKDIKTMINRIENKVIQNLYSKFSFNYIKLNFVQNAQNMTRIYITKLFEYLKPFKFITYHFYNLTKKGTFTKVDFNISYKTNCVFCMEGECLIIEEVTTELIREVINNLKAQQISVINLNSKFESKEEDYAKEETQNFCTEYKNEIINNYFVKYTIRSISCYIIRRYFYPSYYFKDSSFFNFDQIVNPNNSAIAQYHFHKKDFIELRTLYIKKNVTIQLVIHIETFYLFVVKKVEKSLIKYEERFCKKYSSAYFMRFYGYLMQKEEIAGFVYEFMSNGSLDCFIAKEKTDQMYSMFVIIRLCYGIEYLQNNGLIHRDLKPSNILVDHNGIPYISDFETIRSTCLSDGPFTVDIGSIAFSSPEQNNGDNLTCLTDIYSFGKIINYLYEFNLINLNNTKFPPNVQFIYEECVKSRPNDRLQINEINFLLLIYFSFYTYFYIYLQHGAKRKYNKAKIYYERAAEINNSEEYYNLGLIFEEGLGVDRDFLKQENIMKNQLNSIIHMHLINWGIFIKKD